MAASPAAPWSGPPCKRLMADLKQGLVDVVVVYKVDRLTRSLADFAKIVEILDGHGASFVSVTQQFNTTTSMGRLTLNVLLSFAQFEREVTGERIRDKIAASKRKGMWMGGNLPLGYDVEGPAAGRQRGRGGDGSIHIPPIRGARHCFSPASRPETARDRQQGLDINQLATSGEVSAIAGARCTTCSETRSTWVG